MSSTISPLHGAPGTSRFRYVARDGQGKRHRGTLEASSVRGARTLLMEQALEPIRVRDRSLMSVRLLPYRGDDVVLMHFSSQLAAFVRAGIPILDALDAIAEGVDDESFRTTLYDVRDALRAGDSLSESLDDHPRVFPIVYRGVIRSAEHTGDLDGALDRLSQYLERDIDNKRKIRSALAYPMVILAVAAAAVVFLSIVVIPRFEQFFEQLGGELPLTTRMLVGAMQITSDWWWLMLAGIALVALGLGATFRTVGGRAWRDRVALRLPGLGVLLHTSIVERFCRTLGSMVEAAVPLPDALRIAGDGTNNVVFQRTVEDVRDQMMQGGGLAAPIAASGRFPAAVVQMMRAGEHTGTLELQLATAADYFGKELDYRLKRFTALFEPAVIIVAGSIVAFVAIALVSAMYGMFGQI